MESPSYKPILDESERKTLQVLADSLIPPSEKLPFKPSDLQIPQMMDEMLHYVSSSFLRAFRLALRYLDLRAYLFRSSFKKFTEMEEHLRESYLEHWHHSSRLYRRTLMRILESFIFALYYSHPEVTRVLGYTTKLPNKTPSKILYGENVVSKLAEDATVEADVCIIGSGAGGASMAFELAKSGLKVVILEEGGRFDLSDFKGDGIQRATRMYRDAGIIATLGVPPIAVPLGKTIGGTTTINSGTCFRTPDSVFKRWESEYGLAGLNSETMDPYFKKAEEMIHVMEVPEDLLGNSARVIRRGLDKMGFKGAPLKRNMKGCEGSGLCCFGCPTDAKQSVQLNYIPRALSLGAMLYAHVKVDQLLHHNGKVSEAKATYIDPVTREKGRTLRVKAKVFVVAAGTIYTPMLLKGSKLGGGSGQLGKNLTLHPASKAYGMFEEEIRGWEGVPQSYYCADFKDRGITFEGIFTPPSVTAPTLMLRGRAHKDFMENYSHVACFGFLIMDESRGRVWRKLDGEPLITYSLCTADLNKIIEGIVLTSRMFFEAGAKEVYPPIHQLPKISSPDDVSQIYAANVKAKDLEIFAFHPLGTCRMGPDPETSVLDPYGRVHETENLYVSDGSIFPTSLGVNPQLTIMAFSGRIADQIKARHF